MRPSKKDNLELEYCVMQPPSSEQLTLFGAGKSPIRSLSLIIDLSSIGHIDVRPPSQGPVLEFIKSLNQEQLTSVTFSYKRETTVTGVVAKSITDQLIDAILKFEQLQNFTFNSDAPTSTGAPFRYPALHQILALPNLTKIIINVPTSEACAQLFCELLKACEADIQISSNLKVIGGSGAIIPELGLDDAPKVLGGLKRLLDAAPDLIPQISIPNPKSTFIGTFSDVSSMLDARKIASLKTLVQDIEKILEEKEIIDLCLKKRSSTKKLPTITACEQMVAQKYSDMFDQLNRICQQIELIDDSGLAAVLLLMINQQPESCPQFFAELQCRPASFESLTALVRLSLEIDGGSFILTQNTEPEGPEYILIHQGETDATSTSHLNRLYSLKTLWKIAHQISRQSPHESNQEHLEEIKRTVLIAHNEHYSEGSYFRSEGLVTTEDMATPEYFEKALLAKLKLTQSQSDQPAVTPLPDIKTTADTTRLFTKIPLRKVQSAPELTELCNSN